MIAYDVVYEMNDDYLIHHELFSTREMAQRFIDKAGEDGLKIVEREIDRPPVILYTVSPLHRHSFVAPLGRIGHPTHVCMPPLLDDDDLSIDMDKMPSYTELEIERRDGTEATVYFSVWARNKKEAREKYREAVRAYLKRA